MNLYSQNTPKLLLLLFCCLCVTETVLASEKCTNCLDVKGFISNLTVLPGRTKQSEFSHFKVTLYPDNLISYLNQNGEFVFYDVKPGMYRIEIFSINYPFDPIFVEISQKLTGKSEIAAFSYNPFQKKKTTLQYPLVVSAQGRTQYYEVKEEFSIFGMLKSPYGIMIVVSVVMLWASKKMPSLDEMANEGQVQQS